MDIALDENEGAFVESQQQSINTPSLSTASPAAKRRFPSGSSNARDSKTRRREEPKRGYSSQAGWDNASVNPKETTASLMKRDKDEMLDNNLVEHLRKGVTVPSQYQDLYAELLTEIGDPFLQPKSSAVTSKDSNCTFYPNCRCSRKLMYFRCSIMKYNSISHCVLDIQRCIMYKHPWIRSTN